MAIVADRPLSNHSSEPEEADGRQASASVVGALLRPRSIAVIGASRTRRSVGGELLHNLIDGGFTGPVYPVNPNSQSIQGVRAYASVSEIPDPVDAAIIALPAAIVLDAARECIAKGVSSLIVVSAGFAEIGDDGAGLQRNLAELCRAAGVALVGPNCMGIVNTSPDVRMNGQFAPIAPLPGRLGVLSQSGALGLALIHGANELGLGLSSFVSVGNQADLSGDSFLAFWEKDTATDVVLLYLESIANPRRFARIARRVTRTKPIVAVKSGRSAAGERATSSHTGAIIGASDMTVDALFRQAGVIRTDTLTEMFDVATLLSSQSLPRSGRVAILTNGGGPGILAADACAAAGMEVPTLSDDVQASLAAALPSLAGVRNPVDMIASATPADYAHAMQLIASDAQIDSLIVISGPPLATPTDELAHAIAGAVGLFVRPITVVAVFMSTPLPRAALRAERKSIPCYSYPENAVNALAHAVRYHEWRAAPIGRVQGISPVCGQSAEKMLDPALGSGESRWLSPREVRELLECYGLPLVEQEIVNSAAEARAAAARLGTPIALKAISPTVVHKSEVHGVRLNLATPVDVEAAATQMAASYAADAHEVEGFVVQRMAAAGVEMLVGVVHDRLFGPVLACAAGGWEAELLHDVAVRITPLTDVDAHAMVRSLATFPLLDGYRGAPHLDVAALEDVLLRVSAMVEAHPQIVEMDLNPVIALPHGATIVDARVRVEPPQAP